MSSGVGLFANPTSFVPKGSERFTSYLGLPRTATTNWWRKKENNTQPTLVNGTQLSLGNARSAVDGATLNRSGQFAAAPCYQVIEIPEGFALPMPNQPLGATYPEEAQVLIFAETFRLEPSVPLPNNHACLHGFSLIGNLNAAMPPFSAATSWRGIAVYQRTVAGVTTCGVAIKGPAGASLTPIPSLDLSAINTIEHRLYTPTASRAARYQLAVNGTLALELPGTHPDWPIPTVAADATWNPMPILLNNPGGAGTLTMRTWASRIIIGPDSPGTY